MDPEIRELLEQVQQDRESGKLRAPPRRAGDCRFLEDLCCYIFQRVELDGAYSMIKTTQGIERWVWFGHDFRDRLVRVVEEVVPKIADGDALQELRLVATRVSQEGVRRLRRVFPKARVTVYTDEEYLDNCELSQAGYDPEGKK